jgi:MFS family permease
MNHVGSSCAEAATTYCFVALTRVWRIAYEHRQNFCSTSRNGAVRVALARIFDSHLLATNNMSQDIGSEASLAAIVAPLIDNKRRDAPDLHDDTSVPGGDDWDSPSSSSSVCCVCCYHGSPNVWRTMAVTFLATLSGAVWQASVWSPFLKTTFSSNITLGYIAASSGLGEVTAACFSGWAADRFPKERIIRVAGCIGVIAAGLTTVGVIYDHLATLIVASVASGSAYGAFFPCVEGMFANSVPSGRRTSIYNVKYGLETGSAVLGYAMTMVLFAVLGDEWHRSTMKIVIFCGLGIQVVASLFLFSIRDKYMLPRQEEPPADEPETPQPPAAINAGANDDASAPLLDHHRHTPDGVGSPSHQRQGLLPDRWVPAFVALKDMILFLGSGMTVMFFTLFLIDDYGVSPMGLQGILMACPLTSIVFSQSMAAAVGESGACATADGMPRFNRIRVMMVPHALGIFGILYLSLARGSLAIPGVIFVIYVARSAAMNCSNGLSRAILMDLVPETQRAKWNIVESVGSVTWAGSAIVGGAVSDRWGYRSTFLVTAGFHIVSFIVLAITAGNRDRPASEAAIAGASEAAAKVGESNSSTA